MFVFPVLSQHTGNLKWPQLPNMITLAKHGSQKIIVEKLSHGDYPFSVINSIIITTNSSRINCPFLR